MELNTNTINTACKQVAREVRDHHKTLTLHFVVHHKGGQAEGLAVSSQEILHHPAAETALRLMQQKRPTEDSALIGISAARKNLFFGLVAIDPVLAVTTINIDDFESFKEIKRFAYHIAWHAIDAFEYFREQDDSRVRKKTNIIRQRDATEMARANLQADIFSVVMSTLHGDKEAIKRVAVMRAEDLFMKRSGRQPELFPFPVVAETIGDAIKIAKKKHIPKKRYIGTALKIAQEVNKTYDDETVNKWLLFSSKAQDLTWRGYSKKDTLGLSVNMSKDTTIKSTAYLVSEILGIKPPATIDVETGYNPYAADSFNQNLHDKKIDRLFEDVIAQGLREGSADSLIDYADNQNKDLAEGHIFGWCAAALQAAANAFEAALAGGKEPEAPVRERFTEERYNTSWDALKAVSYEVVSARREGEIVTMGDVRKIAENIDDAENIAGSLRQTIEGPAYRKKLENAVAPKHEPDIEPLPEPEEPEAAPELSAGPEAEPEQKQAPQKQAPRVIPAAAALPPEAAQFVKKATGPAGPGGRMPGPGITVPYPDTKTETKKPQKAGAKKKKTSDE